EVRPQGRPQELPVLQAVKRESLPPLPLAALQRVQSRKRQERSLRPRDVPSATVRTSAPPSRVATPPRRTPPRVARPAARTPAPGTAAPGTCPGARRRPAQSRSAPACSAPPASG